MSAHFDITVEIVTGEVLDIIYQIKPLEFYGDPYWVKNYRQKADYNAKMIIDTIIRNTKIGDKLTAHYQKTEKLTLDDAIKKLELTTPLAKNPKLRSSAAIPPPPPAAPSAATRPVSSSSTQTLTSPAPQLAAASGDTTISLSGTGTNYSKIDGPIDPEFKSKRQQAGTFQGIKVWGPTISSRTIRNMGYRGNCGFRYMCSRWSLY